MKLDKVLKPPVASRAAVNKKLGLTQSRQAGRVAANGREEVEQLKMESDHKTSAGVINILGNQSGGEEEAKNVRDGRVCILRGRQGKEELGDVGKASADAVDACLGENEEALDQSDQHVEVQSASGNRERRIERGGERMRGELGTGLSTLERVSKVSRNRTTVTYWSEQFL